MGQRSATVPPVPGVPTVSAVPSVSRDFEERTAIIEYDAGAPREWAEALATLDPAAPPGDVPRPRWRIFIDACGRLLDEGWVQKAAELGWGPLDLFGCDKAKPFARVDGAGLAWFLHDAQLVELHRDHAVMQTRTGARQTFRRQPRDADQIKPVWEMQGQSVKAPT